MSLTSMNNAYRHRLDNREDEVRAQTKAGHAMVRLLEQHPQMVERYARLFHRGYVKK